jgi:hypothetical protein
LSSAPFRGTVILKKTPNILFLMSPQKKGPEVQYFNLEDKPFGQTYGQWTVRWWQWALSMSESISPLVDETGKNAYVNQPAQGVWFLAGTIANEDHIKVTHREVTVPSGRAILFPIINFEANFLEYTHLKTDEELVGYVQKEENKIAKKEVFINEKLVEPKRVISDPEIFPIFVNDDNALRTKGGMTSASADGYYMFLKPLSKGEYDIRFQAACEAGRLNTAVKYRIQVL